MPSVNARMGARERPTVTAFHRVPIAAWPAFGGDSSVVANAYPPDVFSASS